MNIKAWVFLWIIAKEINIIIIKLKKTNNKPILFNQIFQESTDP